MNNQPNQNPAFAHLFKNAPQPRPTPPQEASLNPPTEQEQHKPNSAETGGLEATAVTKLSTSNEPMVKDVPNMPAEQDRPAMPRLRPSDFGIERKKPKKKAAAKPAKKKKKAKKAPVKKKKAVKKPKPKPKKKILKKAAKKAQKKKSVMKKGKKTAKKKPVKKTKKAPARKKGGKGKKRR